MKMSSAVVNQLENWLQKYFNNISYTPDPNACSAVLAHWLLTLTGNPILHTLTTLAKSNSLWIHRTGIVSWPHIKLPSECRRLHNRLLVCLSQRRFLQSVRQPGQQRVQVPLHSPLVDQQEPGMDDSDTRWRARLCIWRAYIFSEYRKLHCWWTAAVEDHGRLLD